MKDENAERLGQAFDRLDALSYGLSAMTGLDPKIHVEGLRGALPEIRDEIRSVYVDEVGDDPWAKEE